MIVVIAVCDKDPVLQKKMQDIADQYKHDKYIVLWMHPNGVWVDGRLAFMSQAYNGVDYLYKTIDTVYNRNLRVFNKKYLVTVRYIGEIS